eukprot:7375956-Prymnesium_polylepis.2
MRPRRGLYVQAAGWIWRSSGLSPIPSRCRYQYAGALAAMSPDHSFCSVVSKFGRARVAWRCLVQHYWPVAFQSHCRIGVHSTIAVEQYTQSPSRSSLDLPCRFSGTAICVAHVRIRWAYTPPFRRVLVVRQPRFCLYLPPNDTQVEAHVHRLATSLQCRPGLQA